MSSTVTCQSGNASSNSCNERLHCSETFDRLESGCKIYEILCKDLIELVQPAGVGGVVIAMKQFERLLIVHAPFLHSFVRYRRSGSQSPDRDPSPLRGHSDDAGSRRCRQAARYDHIIAGRDGHASLRTQKLIGSFEWRTDWSALKGLSPARSLQTPRIRMPARSSVRPTAHIARRRRGFPRLQFAFIS